MLLKDLQELSSPTQVVKRSDLDELEVKLISMGYNGNNVFQCVKANVITHMKKKMLFHFFMGIHCSLH
jgi:hypothetical protein